jgi:NADPH:quinone reductase-like Zn-dependent oxidoreductase
MRAVRLLDHGGPSGVVVEEIDRPVAAPGEALVRVRTAAITRGELDWPVDRLPAIPSYELSGVVEAVGSGVEELIPGDEIFALTPFDRDGVAAEYAAVPTNVLAPKPQTIDHVESAAIPMGALTAWQGLFLQGGARCGSTGADPWSGRRRRSPRGTARSEPRRPCDRERLVRWYRHRHG